MGKLIVIEGSDGSGKQTQSKKLYDRLISEGKGAMKIQFPNYDSQSSALVKMYLAGEFGDKPNDVNPYTASTFYAVDRFASYKTTWEDYYKNGGIVIADRYTTSNMVHQAAKIDSIKEKDNFLDWLWDLEFNKIQLPIPKIVVFLDMPPECSLKLIKERDNKITGQSEKDIHEKDQEYLRKSYENSRYLANKYGWAMIPCNDGEEILSVDEIHERVYEKVKEILNC